MSDNQSALDKELLEYNKKLLRNYHGNIDAADNIPAEDIEIEFQLTEDQFKALFPE